MTPEILADKETGLGWHPKRVLLILLIFSIVMMFAAFTSGYIVRRDEGNWREFDLPASLLINSILIALSSASMQWAYASARKDEISRVKTGLACRCLRWCLMKFLPPAAARSGWS